MLRRLAALVIAPALLVGGLAATSAGAAGDSNAASFVSKANAARQSRGMRAYVVKSDLAAVATRHSQRMASKNSLYHNPNLGSEVSGWQIVGENVGSGGSVDSIHQALMDSPTHRANILSREFTEIGVGTVTDSRGVIWVTQVFRLPAQAAAPVVTAPVHTQASRSVTRTPVRTAPKAPVRVAVKAAPKRPAVERAPVRPDASAFLAALAPKPGTTAQADPFAQVMAYADAMAALAR